MNCRTEIETRVNTEIMDDSVRWAEVLSPDGRVFFYDHSGHTSQWQKPRIRALGSPSERIHDWNEYKIWDGRSFFNNSLSKISVWAPPPEIEECYSRMTGTGELPIGGVAVTDLEMTTDNDRLNKLRVSFVDLLEEYHVDHSFSFSGASKLCSHDTRWQSLQSVEDQKQAFVEFINSRRKVVSHVSRDSEKCYIKSMIIALQSMSEITEAYDYDSLASRCENHAWWQMLSEVRRRSLFEQYVADYARVKSRDDRRKAEKHMGVLKQEIENSPLTDYSMPFSEVSARLSTSDAWNQLDEMQRVSVWRSCVAQYLRAVRSSISAGEGHSINRRKIRKYEDRIRERLLEHFSAGSIDAWKDGAVTIREAILGIPSDKTSTPGGSTSEIEIISKFLYNLREGKEPFSDLPRPVSYLRELYYIFVTLFHMEILPAGFTYSNSTITITDSVSGSTFNSNQEAWDAYMEVQDCKLPAGHIDLPSPGGERVYGRVASGECFDSVEQVWKRFGGGFTPTLWWTSLQYLRNMAVTGISFGGLSYSHSAGSYVDTDFRHDASSIGPVFEESTSSKLRISLSLKQSVKWIRLPHIIEMSQASTPAVLFGNIQPHTLIQGLAGDCWLIAALACLAEYPECIKNIFVSADVNQGRYTLRLFDLSACSWVDMTIDDFVPCTTSRGSPQPLFARPVGNEMWPVLLEKAVAKFVGSYAAICGGHEAFAFISLTGFPQVYQFRRSSSTHEVWERGWAQWNTRCPPTCGFRPCAVSNL